MYPSSSSRAAVDRGGQPQPDEPAIAVDDGEPLASPVPVPFAVLSIEVRAKSRAAARGSA